MRLRRPSIATRRFWISFSVLTAVSIGAAFFYQVSLVDDDAPADSFNDPQREPATERSIRHSSQLTTQGVAIHQSCLDQDPQALEKFSAAFSILIERMQRCQSVYPQMARYPLQWLEAYRELPFSCSDSLEDGGDALQGQRRFGQIILARKIWFGILHASPGSFAYESGLKTIAHEVFHGTGANNSRIRHHNSLMSHRVDYSALVASASRGGRPQPVTARFAPDCEEDYTTDRVEVVSQLCVGTDRGRSPQQFAAIPVLLQARARECSPTHCTRLFQGELYSTALLDRVLGRVKNLSASQAEATCEKIDQVANCYLRAAPGAEQEPREILRNCEDSESRSAP